MDDASEDTTITESRTEVEEQTTARNVSSPLTAAERVFGIAELAIDIFLLSVPKPRLEPNMTASGLMPQMVPLPQGSHRFLYRWPTPLHLQRQRRVSRVFQRAIDGSPRIQRMLFLEADWDHGLSVRTVPQSPDTLRHPSPWTYNEVIDRMARSVALCVYYSNSMASQLSWQIWIDRHMLQRYATHETRRQARQLQISRPPIRTMWLHAPATTSVDTTPLPGTGAGVERSRERMAGLTVNDLIEVAEEKFSQHQALMQVNVIIKVGWGD